MDGYSMSGFVIILSIVCFSWCTCAYELLTEIHTKRKNTCYHNKECLEHQNKLKKPEAEEAKPIKRHQDIRDIIC